MSETVTVIRTAPGGTDQYGDPVGGADTRIDIKGCAVAPRVEGGYQAEPGIRGRQGVIVGLTVYAPPGSDIRSTDQLEVRGEIFDVEGEPGVWVNPWTSQPKGVEVPLRKATG